MDKKQVQTVLQQLQYDWNNFDVTDFVQHVINIRQRHIHLIGTQLRISGFCVIADMEDYIFYDVQRHHTVQLHAILHELAHLVMDHTTSGLTVEDISHLGEVLLHIKMRTGDLYQDPKMDDEEDQAEYFAFLAQRTIEESRYRKTASLTDVSDDIYLPPFTGTFMSDDG